MDKGKRESGVVVYGKKTFCPFFFEIFRSYYVGLLEYLLNESRIVI